MGGTVFNIAIRYMLDCISVLIFVYLLSVLINSILVFDLKHNFYLVLIFTTYMLISARGRYGSMKIFKFIISKIFLRKAILGICVMLLLCVNYITLLLLVPFYQHFKGIKRKNKICKSRGVYIAS